MQEHASAADMYKKKQVIIWNLQIKNVLLQQTISDKQEGYGQIISEKAYTGRAHCRI